MSQLQDWTNQIICGDCLELMKQLPDGCVDLILTDPPYNVGKYYLSGPYGHDDNMPEDKFWEWYLEISKEIVRLMADRSFLYIFSASKQIFKVKEVFENLGLRWIQILIWYGPNTVGGSCFAMPWMQMYEPLSLFVKGKRKKMLNAGKITNTHDVLIESRPQRNFKEGRYHVAQKPLKLIGRIISRSQGEIILDPFIGSGTTAVACKQLRRRFIGFEINPKYVDIANERLRQEVLAL